MHVEAFVLAHVPYLRACQIRHVVPDAFLDVGSRHRHRYQLGDLLLGFLDALFDGGEVAAVAGRSRHQLQRHVGGQRPEPVLALGEHMASALQLVLQLLLLGEQAVERHAHVAVFLISLKSTGQSCARVCDGVRCGRAARSGARPPARTGRSGGTPHRGWGAVSCAAPIPII